MDGCCWFGCVGVGFPFEKRSESEMLNDGKLGQNFDVVHFYHALSAMLAVA